MTFRQKLEAAWQRSGSLLCIGLDPDLDRMPIDDVAAFNIAIIEATSDLVCAYKPNAAFYEALGPERGYAALRKTLAAIPPHVITLVDAKRGDVEHTARAYARAFFDDLGFDACTVNPYLGYDSVEPWIERADKAAFIVCRTSNPGAPDFQDLSVETDAGRRPLYEVVAKRAKAWDQHGNVGLVVGATYPAEMQRLRASCPDTPFLIPGIGAQEGSLAEAVHAGIDARGAGVLISASRGVTYASKSADFAARGRAAKRSAAGVTRSKPWSATARSRGRRDVRRSSRRLSVPPCLRSSTSAWRTWCACASRTRAAATSGRSCGSARTSASSAPPAGIACCSSGGRSRSG